MDIVSSPKVARSLPKPSCLLRESLVCEKLIPKPAPNGKKIYHGMLMLLHDSMPSFMNFTRVLDLLEFKNQVSQCLRPSDGGRVFEFIPISCKRPKHGAKDTDLIFQPVYMHWSTCM